MKRLVILVLLPIALLAVGFIGNRLILNGDPFVTLKAGTVSGAVEQTLQSSSSGSYIPIEGKDYTIKSVKYFDDNQWAVASIEPLNSFSDPALIVLQKKGSGFQTVLGPGSSFKNSDLSALPKDVASYINP